MNKQPPKEPRCKYEHPLVGRCRLSVGHQGQHYADSRPAATICGHPPKEVLTPVELLRGIRRYMMPGFVMPVPQQAKYIVQWIDETLAMYADEDGPGEEDGPGAEGWEARTSGVLRDDPLVKDREIERLHSVIKHMCDELCNAPKNCMMTDCPSNLPHG